jgi:hypothetical protein
MDTTLLAGQVTATCGVSTACTVTVKVHRAVFVPAVAVQVTELTPTLKGDPLGGAQATVTFVGPLVVGGG